MFKLTIYNTNVTQIRIFYGGIRTEDVPICERFH